MKLILFFSFFFSNFWVELKQESIYPLEVDLLKVGKEGKIIFADVINFFTFSPSKLKQNPLQIYIFQLTYYLFAITITSTTSKNTTK